MFPDTGLTHWPRLVRQYGVPRPVSEGGYSSGCETLEAPGAHKLFNTVRVLAPVQEGTAFAHVS